MRCGHPHTPGPYRKGGRRSPELCQREGGGGLFEEMTYLPVRSIGGPCGKEVTWIAYSGGGEDIYLYAP